MPYGKFDPRGEKPREKSFVRREQTSPFVVFCKVLAIFLMLRIVMLVSGVYFIWIPFLDNMLAKLIKLFM